MVYDGNHKHMEVMKNLPDNQKDEWLSLWCGCIIRRLKRMTDKDLDKPKEDVDFEDFTRAMNQIIDDDDLDAETKHQKLLSLQRDFDNRVVVRGDPISGGKEQDKWLLVLNSRRCYTAKYRDLKEVDNALYHIHRENTASRWHFNGGNSVDGAPEILVQDGHDLQLDCGCYIRLIDLVDNIWYFELDYADCDTKPIYQDEQDIE